MNCNHKSFRTERSWQSGLLPGYAVAVIACLAAFPLAGDTQAQNGSPAPTYGPSIIVEARFWKTAGWQSREGDYGYVQLAPGRNNAPDVRAALEKVPPSQRMVRTDSLTGLESLLRQLSKADGFKLGSLAYEIEGSGRNLGAEERSPAAQRRKGCRT